MRRAILLALLVIGITTGAVAHSPEVSFVHNKSAVPMAMPRSLRDDIAYVLTSDDAGDAPQLAVSFSHEEFFYDETIEVAITATNPDAIIYYTLDGSTPTEESARYFAPIEFASGEFSECYVLKAVAINLDFVERERERERERAALS